MKALNRRIGRACTVAVASVLAAAYAGGASAWDQSGNNVSHTGGRVFVGVNAPTASHATDANAYLQVHNPEQPSGNREVARFTANLGAGQYVSYITIGDALLDRKGTQGYLSYSPSGKQWAIGTHFYAPSLSVRSMGDGGYVGIGVSDPRYPLHLQNGAYVSTGGVWTNASSRAYKENIRELEANEALSAFRGLKPVVFNYKVDSGESHIGFIAEDVPDLLATRDRKGVSSMDAVALLTKVVQEQQRAMQSQQNAIATLSERLRALEAKK